MVAVCRDMGIYVVFLVSCRFEKKTKNRVTFPGFWGRFGVFIPLGFGLGGTFGLWTWGRGFVHSWL